MHMDVANIMSAFFSGLNRAVPIYILLPPNLLLFRLHKLNLCICVMTH